MSDLGISRSLMGVLNVTLMKFQSLLASLPVAELPVVGWLHD
jgi:hypothetical protein